MDSKINENGSVKFNWNVFPLTRLENTKLVTPLGCLYTPFDDKSEIPQTASIPITCGTCDNHINPHIRYSKQSKVWWCPFCEKTNTLPDDLQLPTSANSEEDWPLELRESSTSIEHKLPQDITNVNNYNINHIFIVDLYQHQGIDDWQKLQKCLILAIESLPLHHCFTLVTYGDTVQFHGMNALIHISGEDLPSDNASLFQQSAIDKLTSKMGTELMWQLNQQNKLEFCKIIGELTPKIIDTSRIPRCTGLALYSTVLLASGRSHSFNYVKLFTSGPSTLAPGNIVEVGDSIRSHATLVESKSLQFKICRQFYDTLAYIACGLSYQQAWDVAKSDSKRTTEFNIPATVTSCSIDVFVGSVEQVGLKEMQSLVSSTVGNIYMFENWNLNRFETSLLKSFLTTSINHTLSVSTSNHLKVSHLLGGGYALPSTFALAESKYHIHDDKISDHLTEYDSSATKKLFTNRWRFPVLPKNNSLGIYFGINTIKSSSNISQKSTKETYVQFQLKFFDLEENCWKLRITTIKRQSTNSFSFPKGKVGDSLRENELLKGFDQESWTVLLSRLLVNKLSADSEERTKIVELIDKSLIKLLYHFGDVSYKINNIAEYSTNPYSRLNQIYRINESFHLLPALIYNLRKNPQLTNTFNNSPDESTFYYTWFVREDFKSSITIIQPKLYKLVDTGPITVSLDSNSLSSTGCWLVLDSGFQIILYYLFGEDYTNKLQLHPSSNDHLLDSPEFKEPINFARQLTTERQFEPKIIITQTNHSQSRYLISRLNPTENDLNDEFKSISIKEKSGLFSIFKKSSPSLDSKLMTEDASLHAYYKTILAKVKKYDP